HAELPRPAIAGALAGVASDLERLGHPVHVEAVVSPAVEQAVDRRRRVAGEMDDANACVREQRTEKPETVGVARRLDDERLVLDVPLVGAAPDAGQHERWLDRK